MWVIHVEKADASSTLPSRPGALESQLLPVSGWWASVLGADAYEPKLTGPSSAASPPYHPTQLGSTKPLPGARSALDSAVNGRNANGRSHSHVEAITVPGETDHFKEM